MSSVCRSQNPSTASAKGGFTTLIVCVLLVFAPASAQAKQLRVCADPNNMPFSNDRREGFENKIAEIVARDLGAEISYIGWAERRGFLRNTLKASACDLVPGIAAAVDSVRVTRPYYRSGYVFVTRVDGPLINSLDDPVLRDLVIGVQLIGDDGANTPPAHALARRGVIGKLRGYTVYGDYGKPDPQAAIVAAVAQGEIDAGIVWGPVAGYFAKHEETALRITPVTPEIDLPMLPMVYDIGMGVRREDKQLAETINAALVRRRDEIDAVLAAYGVPRAEHELRAASGAAP